MHWILKLLIFLFLLCVHCVKGCSELALATKQMHPAYALLDAIHQRNLPYLFARCTIISLSDYMHFSDCFWRCQQEGNCVAFHHEGNGCDMCMENENNVNSLTTNEISTTDIQTLMHYFVSMERLNAIDLIMISDCGQVRNLVNGSVDGEYCLSLNGSVTQGTRIYCHGLETDNPREYLTLPAAGPDDNFSFKTHHSASKSNGRIHYEKLGLDLNNMQING